MTFPNDHRYPGGLPSFRQPAHSFADVGVAEDIAFEQGEDRARQIYSVNPQMASVATRLTQSEFNEFARWHEDDLRAGSLRFDAQVAKQGGSGGFETAWWEAQFIGLYRWQALSGARYEVTAELLLLDGPYATRTAPSLRGALRAGARLVANPVVDTALRGALSAGARVQGRIDLPALRGALNAQARVQGYLGEAGVTDDELARVWMGLDYTQASVISDDALAAQWMGL